MVQAWVSAWSIAVLVATVPLSWVYKVLQDLPPPVVLSHRRWPFWANSLVIVVSTASTAVFVRGVCYGVSSPGAPAAAGLRLAIAMLVYILAFALVIRQYVGLYPEFFVAPGPGGFTVRKRLYRNVVRIEEVREGHEETEVRIYLESREKLSLGIPTADLHRLYTLIEDSKPDP